MSPRSSRRISSTRWAWSGPRRARPRIRCASSTWCAGATRRRRTDCGSPTSIPATRPDSMIAARFAAMVVVLVAAARALAGPDAGANADAGVHDADVDAAPAPDAAGAGHDATVDGDTVLADAGTDASATPTVPLRARVLEKGTRKPIVG